MADERRDKSWNFVDLYNKISNYGANKDEVTEKQEEKVEVEQNTVEGVDEVKESEVKTDDESKSVEEDEVNTEVQDKPSEEIPEKESEPQVEEDKTYETDETSSEETVKEDVVQEESEEVTTEIPDKENSEVTTEPEVVEEDVKVTEVEVSVEETEEVEEVPQEEVDVVEETQTEVVEQPAETEEVTQESAEEEVVQEEGEEVTPETTETPDKETSEVTTEPEVVEEEIKVSEEVSVEEPQEVEEVPQEVETLIEDSESEVVDPTTSDDQFKDVVDDTVSVSSNFTSDSEEDQYDNQDVTVFASGSEPIGDEFPYPEYGVPEDSSEVDEASVMSLGAESSDISVQVFSNQTGIREISQLILNDPRLPSGVKTSAGSVSHFGETKGGVSFNICLSNLGDKLTVEEGKYEFQGTAKPSLVFHGGILDARATVSLIESYENNIIKLSQSPETSVVTGTLREFMIKAANEKIDEINGVSVSPVDSIDDRTYLVLALSAILSANETYSSEGKSSQNTPTGQADPLMLTFRDLDSLTPKQNTITFLTTALFNTSIDFVKNIINEDSFVDNLKGVNKGRGVSNINLNAEGIAVNFEFKDQDAKKGLRTNTRYEFVGANKDLLFYPDRTKTPATSCISYVEGLTMTPFKTGKQLPLFETYCVSTKDLITTISTIATASLITNVKSNKGVGYLFTSIDFNSINNDSTFIDYNNMVCAVASNVALKIGGTSIKFNTLKIFDQDETISKIEIEDDRLNRYPVILSPIDSNNADSGAYLKVTGLDMSTPYIFRKLYVTASPEDDSITKTLQLVTLSYVDNSESTVTALPHNISLRTNNFTEPKLFIELDPSKAYVSTTQGTFTSTVTKSEVPVFVPKPDVKLPNNLIMPAVKNDKTSLRYVIEVENNESTIKDLTVNGLKGDEQYKVTRVEGKGKTYFILTLFNLSENRDYGFLILELSYTDLDDRELITRQVLSGINVITQVNITIGSDILPTGINQVPDRTLDNTTGPELMGTEKFNVTLFDASMLEARRAEIPVFIDDLNGRFVRMEFKKPTENPAVELTLENDNTLLRFVNLQPNSEVVYKVDFIWLDDDKKEKTLSKYAKISTPKVPAVDIKSAQITTTDTTADIVFTLYEDPKSTIRDVVLSDENMKFTWNTQTLTLGLTGLKPETEYKDLKITFKLENGMITTYKIDTFKTKSLIKPPTGPIADFVKKVYEIALGRAPEVEGWKYWVDQLESKKISVRDFIYGLISQDEFINRYLSKEDFIKVMYQLIVGRDPDEEGQKYWESVYDKYRTQVETIEDLRKRIATDMMNTDEFKKYVESLKLKY